MPLRRCGWAFSSIRYSTHLDCTSNCLFDFFIEMYSPYRSITLCHLVCLLQLPSNMYKKILVILHDSILPHMSKPTLMIDFLTAAYDVGKLCVWLSSDRTLTSPCEMTSNCFKITMVVFFHWMMAHKEEFCHGFVEQVGLSACWLSMGFLSSYINTTCEYFMKILFWIY